MRINLKHCVSVLALLFFILLALGSGTADKSVREEPDITKAVAVSFEEFDEGYSELPVGLYSFDAYIYAGQPLPANSEVMVLQGPAESDQDGHLVEQPGLRIRCDYSKHPIVGYNSTLGRMTPNHYLDQAYKLYVFIRSEYQDKVVELYQIDGLMTAEESAQAMAERKKADALAREEKERVDAAAWEEQKRADAAAREERNKALDEQVKLLAKGYIYHGANEDDHNAGLFNGGALEDGHAYYISGFVVASGGTTAGVTVENFFGRIGNPRNYHVVDYVSQAVRGGSRNCRAVSR